MMRMSLIERFAAGDLAAGAVLTDLVAEHGDPHLSAFFAFNVIQAPDPTCVVGEDWWGNGDWCGRTRNGNGTGTGAYSQLDGSGYGFDDLGGRRDGNGQSAYNFERDAGAWGSSLELRADRAFRDMLLRALDVPVEFFEDR